MVSSVNTIPNILRQFGLGVDRPKPTRAGLKKAIVEVVRKNLAQAKHPRREKFCSYLSIVVAGVIKEAWSNNASWGVTIDTNDPREIQDGRLIRRKGYLEVKVEMSNKPYINLTFPLP